MLDYTLYLCGPMTGYCMNNAPEFERAADALRDEGYTVVNPSEFKDPDDGTWSDFLRRDLNAVLDVDALAVLPDWEASRGAQLEVRVAQALGMLVLPVDVWLKAADDE